jgi:agmatinase
MQKFLNVKCDYKDAKYVIIPVPMELSVSYGKGTAGGPDAILGASTQLEEYDLELKKETIKAGIFVDQKIKEDSAKAYIEKIYKKTFNVLKDKKVPIVLGGEHTLSLGVFKAVKDLKKDFTIVHFDSHLDLRESYEGSKLSHASVLKRMYSEKGFKNLVSIGIRSVSKEENDFLNKVDQKVYYAKDIYNDKNVLNDIEKHLSENIYITFDVDAFDPSVVPSTGTPEPGGLYWYDTIKLLRKIIQNRNLLACDIVELAPDKINHFSEFTVAKLVYKIIGYDNFKKEGMKNYGTKA